MKEYKILFVLMIVLLANSAEAQHVRAFFQTDTILLEPGNTFSNTILLQNTSDKTISIDSIAPQRIYPGMLFVPQFKGVLNVNETKALKIKMIANGGLLLSKDSLISFITYYTYNSKKLSSVFSFHVKTKKADYISIIPNGTEQFFNPDVDKNIVSLVIENPGYDLKKITVKYDLYPPELLILDRSFDNFTLAPKERRLITLNVKKRNKQSFYSDYNLSVSALEGNEVISSTIIKIITITSNRRIGQLDNLFNRSKNYIMLDYGMANANYDYSRLKFNYLKTYSPKFALEMNTQADYFSQYKSLNIYDTWMRFQFGKTGLTFGNVYGFNYDFNVIGRGAKIEQKFNNRSSIEVLGVDNDFLLYRNGNGNAYMGNTVAAKYEIAGKHNQGTTIAYVNNKNGLNNIETNLASFVSNFEIDSIHHFKIEGGLSNEKNKNISADNNASGGALGLTYEVSNGKVSFITANFYSTPKYAGMRRGILSLDETLGFKLSKKTMWLTRYSRTVNKPEYFYGNSNDNSFLQSLVGSFNYRSDRVESGLNIAAKKYTIGLTPNYNYQNRDNYGVLNSLVAYRFKIDLNRTFNNKYFNLSADGGLATINHSIKNIFSSRYMISYGFRNFNLSALADINPFNVFDIYSLEKVKYYNYAVNANYNYVSKNKKFQNNTYYSINYNSYYSGLGNYLTTNFEYSFARSWSGIANAFYTLYDIKYNSQSIRSENFQFRVGIKKNFVTQRQADNYSIALKIYEDINQNGELDNSENIISNAIVRLNDNFAITNNKGIVKFTNIPNGHYSLSLIKDGQKMFLSIPPEIVVNHNKTFLIPVIKTFELRGILKEIKQKYDLSEADISGINIYAQNAANSQTITGITDMEGNFIIRLPEGKYRIYITNDRYTILNNSQQVEIRNEIDLKTLVFEFKKKDINIKVKSF